MTDRDTLRAGFCPLCGAGPFRVPLQHVVRSHGIGGRVARERFDCAYTETLCDPDHRALRRQQADQRPLPPVTFGELVCAACGEPFVGRVWSGGGRGRSRYCSRRCRRRAGGG
jgi:hypothetical protein